MVGQLDSWTVFYVICRHEALCINNSNLKTVQIWGSFPPSLVGGIPEFEYYTVIVRHNENEDSVSIEDFYDIVLGNAAERLRYHEDYYANSNLRYAQMQDELNFEERENWEKFLNSIRTVIDLYSKYLPHELGIYALALEGTTQELYALSKNKDIDLIDPAVQSRLSLGNALGLPTYFEFLPPQPGKRWE
ncbi:MAG: hypothetical protein KGZ96_01155 [Clostridia bacterium]|nr:hypothetical protein [Clostridia bacterium]